MSTLACNELEKQMAKLKPNPELFQTIVTRIPEGFIHRKRLRKRIQIYGKKYDSAVKEAEQQGVLGVAGAYYFDPARLTADDVEERKAWCDPTMPALNPEGLPMQRPIAELRAERDTQLQEAGISTVERMIKQLEDAHGYAPFDDLYHAPEDAEILAKLIEGEVLAQCDDLVYDPLRLSEKSIQSAIHHIEIQTLREDITAYLEKQPAYTAPYDALVKQFYDAERVNEVVNQKGFGRFNVKMKVSPYEMQWVRLAGYNLKDAEAFAKEAVKIPDEQWQPALDFCEDVLRNGAREGNTIRSKVVARSYTPNRAVKYLGVSKNALSAAIDAEDIPTFIDPEEKMRVAAREVERAMDDPEYLERITAYETLRVRDLALVESVTSATIRRRLKRLSIKGVPLWGELRGKWNLPETYPDYRTKLAEKIEEERQRREAERVRQQMLLEEERKRQRQEREELRDKLLQAFPTWQHEGRVEQHISLHVGPPNSGKTHDAIEALVAAGSGWYLAPLRLLAHEIFDRLNRRGVPCNLLTGEEYIPVADAQITAATIEMFNPFDSGDCIIIDEAQMLADSDRGWAWTRALMEVQAPEIHVIAPETAQDLIQKLASEAGFAFTPIKHERLAPIKVSEQHWPLEMLEPRTIVVAFSRRTVLHLKTELEQMRRSVSVVYGSLPPEVRRRQADRFANGETEICVATDAVGMGLNLPADYVVFFEVEKFDGTKVRLLKPAEVQQIGGRAGRYGFSKAGEVGAVTWRDLRVIEKLFHADAPRLTHARVAPTVTDLELIPGNLSSKLTQWAELSSIPATLRDAIRTTDLDERVELAKMLTDEQVDKIGLELAVKLINAPTRKSSRAYWLSCAQSIISGTVMQMPPQAPRHINDSRDLETAEAAISCADIYLWLANRGEFLKFADNEMEVRAARHYWSTQIDEALLRRIDTARRCERCGRRLPRNHRYSICDRCYYSQFG
jgi:hypothetical protein